MILPLSGHDLGIDTGDVDTGIQAGLVVSLDNVTAIDTVGANTAIVWALWAWVPTLWPAVWPAICAKKSVFLLQTEPGLVLGMGFHQSGGIVAIVELVRGAIVVPALAHDNDVVTLAEGIWVHSCWAEIDIGVIAWGLLGRGTVEVPFWEIIDALWGLV